MASGSDREQSEFNMAVSFLNRLNTLFYVADEAALDLDAYSWFHTLLCLMRELSGYMKDTEIKDQRNKNNTIINPLVTINQKDFERTAVRQISPNLYKELEDFELFLRKVLKDSGLQTKMMDDPRRALR